MSHLFKHIFMDCRPVVYGVPYKYTWEQLWLGQKRKCARCGKFVALKNTAKNSCSFDIVCSECYKNPNITVIIDEWSF